MSQISKMKVSGIRSFGPDNPHIIEFYSPLSLILGQNGCGKTTIIEALKYITTGEMPPGCGRGASFVHDPKLARETTVRGQIKLQFHDTRGQKLIATRSLEATQKAKKIECKTLDSTIVYNKSDGTSHSISNKCADFENQMTHSLGVSKSILNNVIFCHQEDSNWPLDEGKKVKEKFDAIFNATKYIKCLESIKKERANMKRDDTRDKEILKELKAWKEEAVRQQTQLATANNQKKLFIDQKEQLEIELEPINKRLKEIRNILNNIFQIKEELSNKNTLLKSLREYQKDLRGTLKDEINCSDEMLFQMINDFQNNLYKKESELEQIQRSLENTERSIATSIKEETQAVKKQGELEESDRQHQDRIKSRNNQSQKFAREFKFEEYVGVSHFNDEEAQSLFMKMSVNLEDERKQLSEQLNVYKTRESDIQIKIDILRSREATLDHDIKNKVKQLEEIISMNRKAKAKLRQNENDLSGESLDNINDELAEISLKITRKEKEFDIRKIDQDIQSGKAKVRELELQLDRAKQIITKMNRQNKSRSEYEYHVSEKKKMENRIEYLKKKNADEMEHILGSIPEENIKNKMEAFVHSLKQRIEDTRKKCNSLNNRKTQLDMSIKNHMKEVEKKEQDVKELDAKIQSVCKGNDFEQALIKAMKNMEDTALEHGQLSSSIMVLQKFSDKLKQKDCCPLCHRDFGTKQEVNVLINELDDKVKNMPAKLKQLNEKLGFQKKVYFDMRELKPKIDESKEATKELQKMQEQINLEKAELIEVNMNIESSQEQLEFALIDEDTARLLLPDVCEIETNMKKVNELTEKIEDIKVTLGNTNCDMTMEEATHKQNELDDLLKKLRFNIDEIQEEKIEYNRNIQALREHKTKLSMKELEIKTKMQEKLKLEEDVSKLEAERLKTEEEHVAAQADVAPLKYQIKDKQEEKDRIIYEKDACIETQNKKIDHIRDKKRILEDLNRSITNYINNGGPESLMKIKQHVISLKEKTSGLDTKKRDFEEKRREIEITLNNQKERKRNLDDEQKVRDKENEAKKMLQEINALEVRISGFDFETIDGDCRRLSNKKSEIEAKQHGLDGGISVKEDEIKELQKTLNQKQYKEAEKNYKEKFVLIKCRNVACKDLNKYYIALDTAIMHFHSNKMKTINSIIRELWRTTYKGNDIDTVEIKTDATDSQGADKRRTYNYRVMMIKNDIEMDMRGRCSAGQKVLASLIIRMSLAETFSTNCGILALDEPTTNLDRENIESLSLALLNIVKRRAYQKNFQLIVISHDTDFLEGLCRAEYIERYHKVTRDEKGLSVISCHSGIQI